MIHLISIVTPDAECLIDVHLLTSNVTSADYECIVSMSASHDLKSFSENDEGNGGNKRFGVETMDDL